MTIITIYKTRRPDGGINIGPEKPAEGVEYETLSRLVADQGKILTNGSLTAEVVDTQEPDAWTEIEGDDITAEEALAIITGGSV